MRQSETEKEMLAMMARLVDAVETARAAAYREGLITGMLFGFASGGLVAVASLRWWS